MTTLPQRTLNGQIPAGIATGRHKLGTLVREKKTTDYMTTDRGSNTPMHLAIISQEETTIQEEMGPVPGLDPGGGPLQGYRK